MRKILGVDRDQPRAEEREVAKNLINGTIWKEWQHSKVVMILKPASNHSKTKGWRSINLINCISK